jgi:hypothetical protein
MVQRTTAPQRLQLHPELFGMAYPASREPEPDWIPDETFVVVMNTKDQFSVLCPQRFIPETVTHATGLRVLILHPDGVMITEVFQNIEDELKRRKIRYEGGCHFETDIGYILFRNRDLPAVRSILAEAGHTVVEPGRGVVSPQQLTQRHESARPALRR